jgi:ribulose-5-phosphate 4-epimerase/fuculose-1-phosphate aldolase
MTIYLQGTARAARDLPMTSEERDARLQLAACYRIFDHLGWTEMIFNHITLRVPGSERLFLINPFGLHYREVTASNLLLVDIGGNPVRESKWPVNRAGFVIHGAIHAAIDQAHCIMHTHTTTGMAVASLRDGLSYTNFYAAQLHGQVAYHDFEGVTVELDEQKRLVQDIGDKRAAILRNHGLLAWGPSLPEAFMLLWTLQRACDVQIQAGAAGELQPIAPQVFEQAVRESGPGEKRLCEDVFNAMRRIVDAKDPSYRD